MTLANDLDRLYRQCRQELFSYALAVAGCQADAEDAIHTAFARTLTLGRSPSDLKTYIFRAVRNAAIDHRRTARRTMTIPEQGLDNCIDDMHLLALENSEALQAASRALNDLPDDEREVIVAHLHSGLKFREIASICDRPLGTVVSWYRRGLETLRKAVEVNHGRS